MLTNYPRIQVALHLLAIASQVASFFVFIFDPALAGAFVAASAVLASAAGVTALSHLNTSRKETSIG